MSDKRQLIAIVDDDNRVRQALRELLESAEYDALSFDGAEPLLCSPALARITCVVTDIGMPGLDGFRLREILHRDHPQLPVILITGRYELAEKLSAEDASSVLRKPFSGKAFLSVISQRLGLE
ncbi:response regulator [Rhizobium sp. Root1204]|uniref:response regulator n=1 Tax=Rhizobium sp. Root1204 TaxID=1736428 RepID=UPI0007142540|nr:response regulator [Rhizobium sp. Root1204]KQV36340.1 hypothetical protein ASC96_28105 [Rhizobium sp. Root1204]